MMEALSARIAATGGRAEAGAAGAEEEAGAEGEAAGPSFASAGDDEIAASLTRSIDGLARGEGAPGGEAAAPLGASELRALIYAKYGKTHDVSFVRRDIPGKSLVSLNIMWLHLEQRSFPLSERAYMEKLEGVCLMLDMLGETARVRTFLGEPARARNGMPARPVVGTAVSITFELAQEVVEEWFGSGYL